MYAAANGRPCSWNITPLSGTKTQLHMEQDLAVEGSPALPEEDVVAIGQLMGKP